MNFAGSTRAAEDRTRWKGIVVKSSVVQTRLETADYFRLTLMEAFNSLSKFTLSLFDLGEVLIGYKVAYPSSKLHTNPFICIIIFF